ncbi:MAG TPA: UBP-type zinc finger domain-containing protein [Chloroflexota bacterium]
MAYANGCTHLDQIKEVEASADGCEDCMKEGNWWVHLRLCMTCGHVGCCDQSPHRHASKHSHAAGHAIMKSFEPGEDWGWCFVDDVELEENWPIRGIKVHTRAADKENERLYYHQH